MKATWHGPKELEKLRQRLDNLVSDPLNPRKHSERNIEAIQASLFQFGQLRPIVVQRSTMRVVAGNGTMRAAAALGWTHLAALVVDLTDAQARAFSVADNRTAELAEWNPEHLAHILGDPALDELLGATGFSQAEIDRMFAQADVDMPGLEVDREVAPAAPKAQTVVDDDEDDEDLAPPPPAEPGGEEGDMAAVLLDLVERIDAGGTPADLRAHLVLLLAGLGVKLEEPKKTKGKRRGR